MVSGADQVIGTEKVCVLESCMVSLSSSGINSSQIPLLIKIIILKDRVGCIDATQISRVQNCCFKVSPNNKNDLTRENEFKDVIMFGVFDSYQLVFFIYLLILIEKTK